MQDDVLLHIGTKRHSGRYPYGSGENPYQNEEARSFLAEVDKYHAMGKDYTDMAEKMNMSTTQLRSRITWANNEIKAARNYDIIDLYQKGLNKSEIAKKLGISDGTVRSVIKQQDMIKESKLDATINQMKKAVDEHGYIDIGDGIDLQLGVSTEKLRAAADALSADGYYQHTLYIKQLTNADNTTTYKVLTKESDIANVLKNSDKIRDFETIVREDAEGITSSGFKHPKSIDSKRVDIRYIEDGGADKDGLIELKRGAEDLDLGTSHYAQVRIKVDGTHYLKGMAIYSDGPFPDGTDIIFNTKKAKGTPKEDVFKALESDPDNPFGATIIRQKGALNIVNEEGTWDKWSGKISSQMLGKQSLRLIKEHLGKTKKAYEDEFLEIDALQHPALKRYFLEKYADGLTTAARKLKAIGVANTKNHVLLPYPDMDPTEVYAPGYPNGMKVALVRHPHGGTFEIANLRVNNNGPAKSSLQNAIDGIGIHPSVAQKLSGADFDGDTVLVIPNNNGKIKHTDSLKGLKGFDTDSYNTGRATIRSDRQKGIEMGKASNLITDMTLKGATVSELERAVKYSMVVIDAKKHKLDHRKCADDLKIKDLVDKYQTNINPVTGKKSHGTSTLLSRANSQVMVEYTNTRGQKKFKKVAMMDIVDDAFKLSSGTAKENEYAKYANDIKALQTKARNKAATIKNNKRDDAAAKRYAAEVASINQKYLEARKNAPHERQALLFATKMFYEKKTPNMEKKARKKLAHQCMASARAKIIPGGKKRYITFTPREWEAIQAHAISDSKLFQLLKHTKIDHVRKLATPPKGRKLSSARATRAMTLLRNGLPISDVARALSISPSAVRNLIKEEKGLGK